MSAILQKNGENRIYFHSLDLIRSVAAFLVVLSHARSSFLQDYRSGMSALWKPLYFISDFGHEAVIIFFVLSGCVVGRIALRGRQAETWSWGEYLFDRLTRLWIVLIPALGLTTIIDLLDLHFAPAGSFARSGAAFGHILTHPLAAHLSPSIFLGNVFFLQRIVVPTFGSNTPLWSLANEFWYYLIFPLLLLGVTPGKSWPRKMSSIAMGVVILILAGWQIAALFPVWLYGAIAFALFQKMPPRRDWVIPGLGAALLMTTLLLVLDRVGFLARWVTEVGADNLLGLACACVIYFALAIQPRPLVAAWAGFFSKFSYSVYLLHLPLIILLAAIFIGTDARRLPPSLLSILLMTAVIAGSYLYAYGVFLLTENNTSRLRRWLKSRLPSSENGSPVRQR